MGGRKRKRVQERAVSIVVAFIDFREVFFPTTRHNFAVRTTRARARRRKQRRAELFEFVRRRQRVLNGINHRSAVPERETNFEPRTTARRVVLRSPAEGDGNVCAPARDVSILKSTDPAN